MRLENKGCEPHGFTGRRCILIPFVCVGTDQPELKQIDQILLKQSHTAATTFILEAVKQNADKSTIR